MALGLLEVLLIFASLGPYYLSSLHWQRLLLDHLVLEVRSETRGLVLYNDGGVGNVDLLRPGQDTTHGVSLLYYHLVRGRF